MTTSTDFGTTTTAKPGDTLEYRLTYDNTGNANATNVMITEPIPNNTSFVSCSDGCAGSPAGPLTWNLGTVSPSDAPKVVTFQVKLASVFPAGDTPVTNTADREDHPGPEHALQPGDGADQRRAEAGAREGRRQDGGEPGRPDHLHAQGHQHRQRRRRRA